MRIPITIFLICITLLIVSYYNIFVIKNCEFWHIGFSDILSFLLLAYITFIFSGMENNQKKKLETLEYFVGKLQSLVDINESLISNCNTEYKDMLKFNRLFRTRIEALPLFEKILNQEDKDYLMKLQSDYDLLIGDSNAKIETIKLKSSELSRIITNLDVRCDDIRKRFHF